jgi:restriction system protein
MAKLPTFDQLMNPLISALRVLGGSGSIKEIYDKVVQLERLPVVSRPHREGSKQTEIAYRLAWASAYLKKVGLLASPKRGVWSLTAKAQKLDAVNPVDVVRAVRALNTRKTTKKREPPSGLAVSVTSM